MLQRECEAAVGWKPEWTGMELAAGRESPGSTGSIFGTLGLVAWGGRHAQCRVSPGVGAIEHNSADRELWELHFGGYPDHILVEYLGMPTAGMRLSLKLPLLDWREAELVWVANPRAGCRLVHPFGKDEIEAIMAAERVLSGLLPDVLATETPFEQRKDTTQGRRASEFRARRRKWLAELRTDHRRLVTLMAELAELTAADIPDLLKISSARMNLTSASRARTILLDEILREVPDHLSPVEAKAILDDLSRNTAIQSQSSRHIAFWSDVEIAGKWSRYQKSSNMMRQLMAERIVLEIKTLYPILAT